MTALLDLPEVRDRIHRVSVSEYHRLGELGLIYEKVELLRGIIVDKMSKSPLHEYISQKLLKLLHRLVPPQFDVRQERPLTLNDSEPEPDIAIVAGAPEDWVHSHPKTAALVIEISISSFLLDRSKADIYAEASIPEFWLVRADKRLVEVYLQPSIKGYLSRLTFTEADTLTSATIPEATLRLSEIFPAK